jgi:hypothetical protein
VHQSDALQQKTPLQVRVGSYCRKSQLSASFEFLVLVLVLDATRSQKVFLLPGGYPLRRLRGRRFGGRAEQAERHGLEVLDDGGEVELVARAGKAT